MRTAHISTATMDAKALLLVLCFSVAACYPTFEYCAGTPWIRFGDHCYLFQSKSRGRVSYYDAEDYCRSQGAHLASVHSEAENEFILNTMQQGGFGGRLWIGLTVLDGEDSPRWSDDTAVDYQKRVRKEFFKGEKCFMMHLAQRGWRPEHCALHYPPLCKRRDGVRPTALPPPTTVAPPEGRCPGDWIQFGPKCYKYFGAEEKDRLQYKEAAAACQKLGKRHFLVSVHGMEEQAFLTQHLSDLGTSAWIGISRVESDEIGHDIVFGWADNTRNDFAYWAEGHPPPGTWKYCGRLEYDGVNKGEWIADYCEVSKRGYVCQAPTDPSLPEPVPEPSTCDPGFQAYVNSCYIYSLRPETPGAAEQTCRKAGGHLVSIGDAFEQAFLYNFLANRSTPAIVGLASLPDTRIWRWTDGSPLYYSNWADDSGDGRCVHVDPSDGLRWKTVDCDASEPYVCEISKDAPPEVPVVVGECPASESRWLDVGDASCYHVADPPNRVLSWDAASRYCLTKGMKMVSVHSDHVMKSLVAYLWKESRNVHLGLLRSFDKKSFLWADGTPLDYTHWADREPSSWSGDKDCVAFTPTDGRWTPVRCSDGGLTLCRADKKIVHQKRPHSVDATP